MKIDAKQVRYAETVLPKIHRDLVPVDLSDETMKERFQKVLRKMHEKDLDVLIIYADREHGSNFGYLTGFSPRFEEALLILHSDGTAYAMLGNEMLRMAQYSRIVVKAVHVPHFSLPDQPMETEKSFCSLLLETGLKTGLRTGMVGWKLLRDKFDEEQKFDVPHFIVDAVMRIVGADEVVNATGLFIDPEDGVRITVNANEIAFYEYGSSLASVGMSELLENLEVGKTELELAGYLENAGQPNSVQTICATGERFTGAVVSPRNKKTALGDRFSATVGYRGGLTNRSGYLATAECDLPDDEKNYLQKVVFPYFSAAVSWYTTVGVGVCGSEVYRLIEEVIPRQQFGWSLNPGHYTADEEWVSSPFTKDSKAVLRSGMLLQMDIILKVEGYGGCNAEDGIAIMDKNLQNEVKTKYPEVWGRFVERKSYMKNVLGISMKDEVFPMSDLAGYVRPLLLDRKKAMSVIS